MIDTEWLIANQNSKQLRQSVFFELSHTLLFLPSLAALRLLRRAEIVTHTDSLYSIDQAVYGDKTLAYIVKTVCPTVKVYANLVILHSRKTIDTSIKHKIYVQNTLPHFHVVNNTSNTTSMFCRDVTTAPRT